MLSSPPPEGMLPFVAGLPQVAERALYQREREILDARFRESCRFGLAGLASIGLSLGLLVVWLRTDLISAAGLAGPFGILQAVLFFGGSIGAVLLYPASRLKAVLAADTVHAFEGTGAPRDDAQCDRIRQAFTRPMKVKALVLSHRNEVLLVDGLPINSLVGLRLKPKLVAPVVRTHPGYRGMTEAERFELADHLRDYRAHLLMTALSVIPWISLSLFVAARPSPNLDTVWLAAKVSAPCFVLLTLLRPSIWMIRTYPRLKADLERGEVHTRLDGAQVLVASGAPWVEGGRPCGWRTAAHGSSWANLPGRSVLKKRTGLGELETTE